MDPEKTLAQLNKVMRCCQNSPFYRSRYSGQKLKSLAEFQRLPLTTPEDIRNNAPFGMLCTPWSQLCQYYESFIITEDPVPVWLTREDFQLNTEALSYSGLRFQDNDIVLVRFPYSLSEFAHTLTAAAQLAGACVVPAGAHSKVSPFPRVIQMLQKLKVTVLAGLPLQVLLMAETAELMGFEPKRDFPDLRVICTAGEVLAPGRRLSLENIWGVPVFDHYGPDGVGTIAVACRYQRLHPLKDAFYLEILREDLQTPVETGETGYLVVTTLKRQGMPLLRYINGDLARLTTVPCPCGAPVVLEFRGQAQCRFKLESSTLDLWDIEELVSRLPCRRFWIAAPGHQVLPGYQASPGIQAGTDFPAGADTQGMSFQDVAFNHNNLEIIVEVEKLNETVTPEIIARTCKSLETSFGVRLRVKLVPRGTLYDREALLSIGVVGKPQYLYTAPEMAGQMYLQSARI